jgi:hypothetical protein
MTLDASVVDVPIVDVPSTMCRSPSGPTADVPPDNVPTAEQARIRKPRCAFMIPFT